MFYLKLIDAIDAYNFRDLDGPATLEVDGDIFDLTYEVTVAVRFKPSDPRQHTPCGVLTRKSAEAALYQARANNKTPRNYECARCRQHKPGPEVSKYSQTSQGGHRQEIYLCLSCIDILNAKYPDRPPIKANLPPK